MERRLPTELTRFIGRDSELAELRSLLRRGRLLTLTGAGGSGKTRLALELAAGWDGDAVYWAELAPVRDDRLLVQVVGTALGIAEELRPGDHATLADWLGSAPALLVLDNCEHLVDGCAALADHLLRRCPQLVIVATSREALAVPGERAWLVPPLALPQDDSVDGTAGSEAVRLFLDRASDVAPSFELTAENASAVAEICRRLDGIPLALELAAARVRTLAPGEIRDRLDDVFHLLPAGARTAPPRHRTLRATIDWSHDLLTPDARAVLRRLSVFRGGFTLEGAESVAAGPVPEAAVLDLVARLVDRSLIMVREQQGVTRYAFLEAVRQYAREKLQESGEEEDVRRRHAEHILDRVAQAAPHLIGPDRRVWVDRLNDELDDIRSALAWSRDHRPDLHVRLVGSLWWFWFSSRHWIEAGHWLDEALALPEARVSGIARATLLFAAGALGALQARGAAARPALEEAVALSEEHGDRRLLAYALNYLGMTYVGEGLVEGEELCRRAEQLFRHDDDLYGLRLALLLQGSAAMGRGDLQSAVERNREGVAVARRFGSKRELAVALQNLAAVHLAAGRPAEAEPLVREALAASREDPSLYFIGTGIAYLAEIEAGLGRPLEALRLFGAAETARARVGASAFPLDTRRQAEVVDRLRQEVDEPTFSSRWDAGRMVQPERLVEELAGEKAVGPAPAVAPVAAASPPSVEVPPDLRVLALGPLIVEVRGHQVEPDRWTYAKPRELLCLLLLEPNGLTRDRLCEALWPEASRSRAKNSFHVTLHHLRKTLDHPDWIVLEGERYRLSPDIRTELDLEVFETRARALLEPDTAPPSADRVRAVLRLYRGQFLDDEVVGRWADEPRDRARRWFIRLNLALGESLQPERPEEAAEIYQRLALIEELDEEVHRRLMVARAAAGNRAAALQHYDRVVQLLRSVLDAEPEPATVAVYETIRAGSPLG